MEPRSSVGLPDIGTALNRPSQPPPVKPPEATAYQPASPRLEAAVLPVLPRRAARARPCGEPAAALVRGVRGVREPGESGTRELGRPASPEHPILRRVRCLSGRILGRRARPGASSPGPIRVGAPPPIRSGGPGRRRPARRVRTARAAAHAPAARQEQRGHRRQPPGGHHDSRRQQGFTSSGQGGDAARQGLLRDPGAFAGRRPGTGRSAAGADHPRQRAALTAAVLAPHDRTPCQGGGPRGRAHERWPVQRSV